MLQDEASWPHFLKELRLFLGTDYLEESAPWSHERFSELTSRERQVLDLMAQGLANDEIAADLVISPKTVRNYVARIYDKLQVINRAPVVLLARVAGFGQALDN